MKRLLALVFTLFGVFHRGLDGHINSHAAKASQ